MKTSASTRIPAITLAFASLLGWWPKTRAAEGPEEEASQKHLFAVMELAVKDRSLAVKQTLDGLERAPTTQLWGIELAAIFANDEFKGRPLRGAERMKFFAGSRDYLQSGLALAEKALKEHPDDESLIHQVGELKSALALASLESGDTGEARKLAQQRLDAATDPKDWNYGNVIHNANELLGRAALRDGNKQAAAEYLLKAGATPGSPQLNSFGPRFTLARELLEAGDSKSVLAYLDLVEKFWVAKPKDSGTAPTAQLSDEHAAKLNQWREAIRAGRVPADW